MYLSIFQTPSRLEPVLADKEVLLTALNIKAMTFTGLDQDEYSLGVRLGQVSFKVQGSMVQGYKWEV